jgi:hypothetical protein
MSTRQSDSRFSFQKYHPPLGKSWLFIFTDRLRPDLRRFGSQHGIRFRDFDFRDFKTGPGASAIVAWPLGLRLRWRRTASLTAGRSRGVGRGTRSARRTERAGKPWLGQAIRHPERFFCCIGLIGTPLAPPAVVKRSLSFRRAPGCGRRLCRHTRDQENCRSAGRGRQPFVHKTTDSDAGRRFHSTSLSIPPSLLARHSDGVY